MKTSQFTSTLRAQSALPLVFRAGPHTIDAGYHLTEVKNVAYRTMDCGGVTNAWVESQFELWAPSDANDSADRAAMAAGKFLAIVDRVQQKIALDGESLTRVFAAIGNHPAGLYGVSSLQVADHQLIAELVPDRVRCKAAERRGSSATGCCGTALSANDSNEQSSGCGCATASTVEPAAACCA